MTVLTCAHHGCTVTFTPTRATRRFCSPQCARRARTLRDNQQLARHDGLHAYTSRNGVALDYDDPRQVRADIAAVLADPYCWISEAYDCALHAERLLAEVLELRKAAA